MDVLRLAALLREAEEGHHSYEAVAPEHHWSGWYAAYVGAREEGRTPPEAAADAGAHVERELADRGPIA